MSSKASNITAQIERAMSGARIFPFWRDSNLVPAPEPEQIGETSADLVVIGGGFTGLWAALQAREASPGRDILLLEANTIASGASGRPGGIISTSIMHGLINTVRTFPKDVAILEKLGQENMDGFTETLDRHGIDADIEWSGEMVLAISEADVGEVKEEYGLHLTHGHNVSWLDRDALQQQIRSPAFHSGFWSKDRSGTVHPAKLAWGLKKAIRHLGVRVHENSPMLRIETDRGISVVHTPHGHIRANRILLATDSWGVADRNIRRRMFVMHDRALATEPLSAEQMSGIGWKNRQGIYDSGSQLNYMRLTKDNRIVFGGHLDYFFGNGIQSDVNREPSTYYPLLKHFFRKFPQLDDIRITNVWSGPIGVSTRMAIQFQKSRMGNAIWVGGYSGFGVGASRFGARLALAMLDGTQCRELELDFARKSPNYIPPEPLRWMGTKLVLSVLDDIDKKGGWRHGISFLGRKVGFPM